MRVPAICPLLSCWPVPSRALLSSLACTHACTLRRHILFSRHTDLWKICTKQPIANLYTPRLTCSAHVTTLPRTRLSICTLTMMACSVQGSPHDGLYVLKVCLLPAAARTFPHRYGAARCGFVTMDKRFHQSEPQSLVLGKLMNQSLQDRHNSKLQQSRDERYFL
jgi:hypothetical protein